MKPDFWRERWDKNQIGFHEPQPNRWLVRLGSQLLPRGAKPEAPKPRVLVPLCGKSPDLLWLAEHGFRVTGIELVERAARAFFEENQLAFSLQKADAFDRLESDTIEIYIADFFAVPAEMLGTFDAAYDRAALVALPPHVRPRYAERFVSLMTPGAKLLLVAFEYEAGAMNGPPFSVGEAEVRKLYEPHGKLELLSDEDILDSEPRFKERGLTWLREQVWLFTASS